MKPGYTDEYKGRMGKANYLTVTANGLDRPFRELLGEIATANGTSLSALAFEGLTRVIEDRLEDPEFVATVMSNPQDYPLVVGILSAREDARPPQQVLE